MQLIETQVSTGFSSAMAIASDLATTSLSTELRGDYFDVDQEGVEDAPGCENVDAQRHAGLLAWQVRRVRDHIGAELHRRLPLSAAAHQARLSPGYFSRCFRKSFGVTFSRYVATQRVRQAQRLMLEGAGELCQIALDCGFCDQAHLTRTFSSVVGCPPARWLRQAPVVRRLA